MVDPQRRQALFTFADARGNNPHGTSEDAVHEAQRLNAQRYETVDQMNARLDARAQRPLGEVALAPRPMTAGETFGVVLGLGLLGAAALLIFGDSKKRSSDPQPGDIIETKVTTTESLAAVPPAPVPNPAPMLALPAPVVAPPVVVVNPVPVPVAKRARRRRSTSQSAKPAQQTVDESAKTPAK